MPTIIKRKNDGRYIKELSGFDGYRHIVFTSDESKALRVDEDTIKKICDFDFFGKAYDEHKYNHILRMPEFEAIDVLF